MNEPLRVLLGGDVMLGRLVGRVLARHGAAYPLEALGALTASADLFMVNLECALSPRDQRYRGPPKAFYFRAEPGAVQVLSLAGVDLVSLANNHALDADVDGLNDTLAELASHGIASAGAGPNLAAAAGLRRLSFHGHRVGVLAACDHQPDFAAGPQRAGIHYLAFDAPDARQRLLERVRQDAQGVDHLIVSLHWMSNWVAQVPLHYQLFGDALLRAGARVVWGHGPHHILGSKFAERGVVLYSTGNLLDDYALEPLFRNDRQLLYRLDLADDRVDKIVAWPLELAVGRTVPARAEGREWIQSWLRQQCGALGSTIVPTSDDGFELRPQAARP